MGVPESALRALEGNFSTTIEALVRLARVPGISAHGYPAHELERSADAVAQEMRSSGLEHVEMVRIGGAHPYVVGDWLHAGASAPTALIYAHHDVQPPGRPEKWQTPAFEPSLRADGRLYGRGVVDDKAGLMVHLAAVRACFTAGGAPPLNLKLVVEGEEEIGSPHLGEFLREHRERLAADVILLSDTANLEAGVPSLTTSLRGLVSVDVRVRALDHPLHSGMWGGPVADAATALVRLLARLVDDRGVIQIPGVYDDVRELSTDERARLARLPFDEKSFREQAGLVASGALAGEPGFTPWERLWFRPSLAVTALEGVPLASAANQLMDEASARVGLRLAPSQDAARAAKRLVEFLRRDPPSGVAVDVGLGSASGGWECAPAGPAFDAARIAHEAAFGRELALIGCGGSIPFVGPFAEVLGGAPVLLLGLEDPICNAHGENESLNVDDFRNAARSALRLYFELAARLRPR
ncbi:MAG: M20/M25/M40 family metallo-hydrolase [Deltaproteobacteria bacterium]|nr:M20/M25/M40 family metallo-hydrolase [Deltaproteobacteria bacterium]